MRILIATSTYYPAGNGQAVFTTNLAEGLAKRGHAVEVVVDSHAIQASQKYVNGVLVDELRSYRFNGFHAGVSFTPFPGKHVSRVIDQFHPEIVHIQDHYPVCWAAAVRAKRRGIKLVGSNHFIPENLAPYVPLYPLIRPVINWCFWQWMLLVYRKVDAIAAQSRAATKIIKAQGLSVPILPISCGIDLQRLYPNPQEYRKFFCQRYSLDPSKKIFLYLGRIDGEKRIDLLIRAMQALKRDDIQLAIAGRGRVEKELKQMATRLGLEERARFTGFIPAEDVPGLLNSIDIFVMPSEAELLSISTLEAMACGKPVLLADALALPELLRDGLNGYSFKPGDVQDLVKFMNLMADHPENWHEMGAVSREIASMHSLDEVINKYESLYAQLIGEIPAVEAAPAIKETA